LDRFDIYCIPDTPDMIFRISAESFSLTDSNLSGLQLTYLAFHSLSICCTCCYVSGFFPSDCVWPYFHNSSKDLTGMLVADSDYEILV
jgi:hypothetical protein